jgi:pSer/pThr/pTyr-binding forkhead associated (FHA) protein
MNAGVCGSVKLAVGDTPMPHSKPEGYYLGMNEPNSSHNSAFPGQGIFLIINKQILPLKKRVTTLGRQLENDIVFHEEFLSRFHAEIVYEQDAYVLYDKESTSGTYVNSRKIDRCVLNSGDLISLANISMMFVDNNPKIAKKSLGTTQSLHSSYSLSMETSHE